MIYNESAIVKSNIELAEGIYKTILYSPQIAASAKPGQFINILPKKDWSNVMRRPMSIASQNNEEISIIYKAIGEGTIAMSNWELNSFIDIIGPLGNFWTDFDLDMPILVGGGVGIAPIINLHSLLLEKEIGHYLIMGARNGREHFLDHNEKERLYLSTDDGSKGIKGNVVDVLNYIISDNQKKYKIFSCGPPMMMNSLSDFALSNNMKCDIAVETIMACGIGICQGCTVERIINQDLKEHSYRSKFALACVDGPIFNSSKIQKCI
jgi:dihydroorotate dehydrogenase electron transfer subunit